MNLHELLYRLFYVTALSTSPLMSQHYTSQITPAEKVENLTTEIEKANEELTTRKAEFTINISVLVDELFTGTHNDWTDKINEYISFAEQEFSKLFTQKRVAINILNYEYFRSNSTNVKEMLIEMYLTQLTQQGDLVVYFTGMDIIGSKKGQRSSSTIGYADKPGRFSIVEKSETSNKTLIHEIGHNLGLSHSKDSDSFMFWQAAEGTGFDKTSKEIITYMLERYFATYPLIVTRRTPYKEWLYTRIDTEPMTQTKKQRHVMNPSIQPVNKSITRSGDYRRRPRDNLHR